MAWIGNPYRGAKGKVLAGNEIIRTNNAGSDYKPFRLECVPRQTAFAREIEFRSNTFTGSGFGTDKTDHPHSYRTYSILNVQVTGRDSLPLAGREATVSGSDDEMVFSGNTCGEGWVSVEFIRRLQTETHGQIHGGRWQQEEKGESGVKQYA